MHSLSEFLLGYTKSLSFFTKKVYNNLIIVRMNAFVHYLAVFTKI